MELYDFIEQYNYENVFKELNKNSLIDFYKLFKEEVKIYKEYLLTAIDGSDYEIPNTPTTRERYKNISGKNDGKSCQNKIVKLL